MYTATSWTDHVTPGSATNFNHLETSYAQAVNSLNQDLFAAGFVYHGYVATKDGMTANQLDVTSGVAYALQSDGTTYRIALTSSTQATSSFTTTYYLDLQPDGTWSWGTSHSIQANYLPIAQVTTDGSGNISTVTDERNTTLSPFASMVGVYSFSNVVQSQLASTPGSDTSYFRGQVSGDTGTRVSLYQRSATNYGGIRFSAGDGLYSYVFGASNGLIIESRQSGSASGVTVETWSGAANVVLFSFGGQLNSALSYVDVSGNYNAPAGGGIPTTRAGTATSVPIYTSTSSPSTPPTGSIWVKA
jgi:hypothetical protein